MNNKYLLVISIDGLSELDFKYIEELPNFREIIENSSYCRNVRTIYPSLTYPAHTTIVTGCYPNNHGIINNTKLDLKRKTPDWYWYQKDIRKKSLFDLARQNNKKTAALLWPVTAKGKIRYNMPEIFSNRIYHNQILISALSGSLLYQLKLNRLYGNLRDGLKEPNLGNFLHKSLIYTLKNCRQQCTFVHYTGLDTLRHKYGFSSEEATEELKRTDKRLGEIIKTLKERKIYDKTALAVLGDHSSKDVKKVIYLNSLFYKKGYINVKNNKIKDFKVLAKTCDGSSYIYIKDKNIKEEIFKILTELKNSSKGIEEIYDSSLSEQMGFDRKVDYIIEGKEGYYFNDNIKDEYIMHIEDIEETEHKINSSHGYHPDKKDYRTVFILKANGIKKNFKIESMSLIDIAPTIAETMNFEKMDCDGKILKEIFI